MTKKERNMVETFKYAIANYPRRALYQCYENPSTAKRESYHKLLKEAYERCGKCVTVTSYNTMQYTLMYYVPDERTLVVETARNHYEINNVDIEC